MIWKVENVSGNYGYRSVVQFVMLLEKLFDLWL